MTDESGTATVLALSLASVLMLVGLAGAWTAGVVVSLRRAQSAADLSALAGAQAAQRGLPACVAAGATAVANGVTLATCVASDTDIWVSVAVPGPSLVGRTPQLVGEAHAGPAR